jgi:flagellar basal-body rod protein FlgC
MPSFNIFDIAGSGMSAQTVRLNTTASNLANADSVSTKPQDAYKARHPVFKAVQAALGGDQDAGQQVQVAGIMQSTAQAQARYEPGNPLANADGYVYTSNVNTVEEMVDMISASRSYQNNVEIMNTSKDLMLATLKLGQ